MINKESVNKARSLYYGFMSKMFVFTTAPERYKGVKEALSVMAQNPIDENSGEALKELEIFFSSHAEADFIQEYDDLFHNPSYKVIRNTASYYDEGVESGHQRLAVKNFLAKTKLRRDEAHFKENEDSVGFLFTFMHELIELVMQKQTEYENLQHCLFSEVINPFIDEFIVAVYEHPRANMYKSIAIVLNAFIAFERLYFEVAKPPYKEQERQQKPQPLEIVSGAEARRRAENKAKKEADKAKKAVEV